MSQPTEIHTLAGAYALDALTEIERAAFARHVAECSSCAIEVAELNETASRLSAPLWETPPARLRESVLAEVGRTHQALPGRVERAPADGVVRRWRRWTAAAVAAGVVAIGGVATVWTVEQTRIDDLRQQAASGQADQNRLNAILAVGDARIRTSSVGPAGRMTVVVSPSLGDGVVLMSNLPPLPAGRTYQAWLIAGREATSVGVMPEGAQSGSATLAQIGSADTVGVTVEPAGGSKRPTSDPIGTVPLV
jgi:anti-sigma-K factor RskA